MSVMDKKTIVNEFVSFCKDELGFTNPIKISLTNKTDKLVTHAIYDFTNNEIRVYSKNRHLVDVLRSLAHELVHHKQIEDGRIDFNNLPQDIGGEIEDEANSLAGQIIKKFTYKFDGIYE